ncbi:MAG: hypothetical protein ABIP48_12800 [Planctomycetota bacterium]
MKTTDRSPWLILLTLAITLGPWARQPVAAAPPEGPKFARRPIEDLAGPAAREPNPHDPHRVFHVADVARRIVQFQAPLESIQRGYNRVVLRLTTNGNQKVIWLELYVEP